MDSGRILEGFRKALKGSAASIGNRNETKSWIFSGSWDGMEGYFRENIISILSCWELFVLQFWSHHDVCDWFNKKEVGNRARNCFYLLDFSYCAAAADMPYYSELRTRIVLEQHTASLYCHKEGKWINICRGVSKNSYVGGVSPKISIYIYIYIYIFIYIYMHICNTN